MACAAGPVEAERRAAGHEVVDRPGLAQRLDGLRPREGRLGAWRADERHVGQGVGDRPRQEARVAGRVDRHLPRAEPRAGEADRDLDVLDHLEAGTAARASCAL